MDNEQYWNDVYRIKKDIYDRMCLADIDTIEGEYDINPFDSQIIDNGAIGLKFDTYFPSILLTTLGSVDITSYFVAESDLDKEKEFFASLKEDYGLVLMKEGKPGVYGPIYSITKLPWSNRTLPLFEFKSECDYVDYDAAYEILFEAVTIPQKKHVIHR